VFFDDEVRRAAEGGVGQVVVIGAGYDSRAWRFARPSLRFFEVDHPATQAAKRLAIDERRNLDFIAADLAEERLQDALAGGAYRRDASSVFVIEGLLMYLTDAQIAVLFAAIAELQRAPGTLVFTVMEPASDGRPRSTTRRRSSRGCCRCGASRSGRRCGARRRGFLSSFPA